MEQPRPERSGFVERIVRAAKLETALYEEVEADPAALGQAMVVVLLASVSASVGSAGGTGIGALVTFAGVALAAWYIWAALIYFIGTRLLPGPRTEADVGQLLRTIGFAAAPGCVRVLGVIPVVGVVVFFVAVVWELMAMVVAVRQALDYDSTGRAIGVCAVGWLVQLVVLGILLSLFSPPPVAAA
ncbi:MAG: YIP1 family protein [Candidatus Binatia bacterium]|nr:YIP1 family protein [Candidatus Binatia bacterium]